MNASDSTPTPATSPIAAQVGKDYQCVALVLQGGGALGAYQAGVVEALEAAQLRPDWVAGISIGALNAAIIAGNRTKEIQYSSRTRMITDAVHESRRRQRLLHDLMRLVPAGKRDNPAFRRAAQEACGSVANVIHLIYRDKPYEGHYKDFEFSAASMQSHWHSGLADMQRTLAHPQWFATPSADDPFVTHDVHRKLAAVRPS